MRALSLVLVLTSCWLARPAAAQSAVTQHAVLFAPGGHHDLAASAGPAAVDALSDGLRDAGWEVLSPSEAGARLDATGQPRCAEESCVSEMLQTLQADMAIAVAIWARHGEHTAYQVALTFMPRLPPAVNATAQVHAGDVPAAVREALHMALIRWGRRHEITLRVEGAPEGAAVTIDGHPRGRLPYEAHVSAGEHDVSVSQRGHVTERHDIHIPEQGDTILLHVSLAQIATDSAARTARVPSAAHDLSRPHPVVGPLLLAGVGATSVGWGAWAASRGGCIERNGRGECVRERRVDTLPAVLGLVGGGLALVGAVLWFSLGGSSDSAAHAQLGVRPDGVELRLHY